MYFICIWYFSSISILFRNNPFFSEPYSGGVLYRHLNNVLTGVGEPFINFKISADFKRDCVYFWCHFCMIGILFISLFTLKFGSRHRWRVIFFFYHWTEIKLLIWWMLRLTSSSCQAEEHRLYCLFFALPASWFSVFGFHGDWKLIDFS